jgi:hypothetical protein
MIQFYDLSSDELDDAESNASRVSSNACASSGQGSSNSVTYNASNIKRFLKEQPEKYVLLENHKVNHVKPSPCWDRFALPAVNDETDRSIIIENFASCRSYFTTYAYTHGSTKSLNLHKCFKEPSSTLSRYCSCHLFLHLFWLYF